MCIRLTDSLFLGSIIYFWMVIYILGFGEKGLPHRGFEPTLHQPYPPLRKIVLVDLIAAC